MRPRLLVLDEPLSQLDDDGARSLVTTLAELAGEGTAVVLAEHRLDQLGDARRRAALVERRPYRQRSSHRESRVAAADARDRPTVTATAVPTAAVAWQLSTVAAGPARTPVLEGVTLEGEAARSLR